jgi:hypothetical protein
MYSLRSPIAAAKARISCSLQRHLGKNHRFATAVRQTGRGILEGHRPRQSEGFLGADVGRHLHAADRRSAGDVVDGDHRFEADRCTVNVDELEGAELLGKAKQILFDWA